MAGTVFICTDTIVFMMFNIHDGTKYVLMFIVDHSGVVFVLMMFYTGAETRHEYCVVSTNPSTPDRWIP